MFFGCSHSFIVGVLLRSCFCTPKEFLSPSYPNTHSNVRTPAKALHSTPHLHMEQPTFDKVTKVACVGAGYVGGTTMPIIAKFCPDITCTVVDIDEPRIAAWNSENLPIYEPNLQEIVEEYRGKNLFFTSKYLDKGIREAQVIFIAVNTGTKSYGMGAGSAYDMTAWEAVARSIAKHATEEREYIIVEKSTVPVKTAEQVQRILDAAKHSPKTTFEVVSNPEFLAGKFIILPATFSQRAIL